MDSEKLEKLVKKLLSLTIIIQGGDIKNHRRRGLYEKLFYQVQDEIKQFDINLEELLHGINGDNMEKFLSQSEFFHIWEEIRREIKSPYLHQ